MKTVQGGLFVVIGLLILYMAVTGKLDRLGPAISWLWTGKDIPHFLRPEAPSSATPQTQPRSGVLSLSRFGGSLPPTLSRAFS